MKKIGILIFVVALVAGVTLANITSFGKASGSFLKFSMNFGAEHGSGNVATEKRDLSGFKSVEHEFELTIRFRKSPQHVKRRQESPLSQRSGPASGQADYLRRVDQPKRPSYAAEDQPECGYSDRKKNSPNPGRLPAPRGESPSYWREPHRCRPRCVQVLLRDRTNSSSRGTSPRRREPCRPWNFDATRPQLRIG